MIDAFTTRAFKGDRTAVKFPAVQDKAITTAIYCSCAGKILLGLGALEGGKVKNNGVADCHNAIEDTRFPENGLVLGSPHITLYVHCGS